MTANGPYSNRQHPSESRRRSSCPRSTTGSFRRLVIPNDAQAAVGWQKMRIEDSNDRSLVASDSEPEAQPTADSDEGETPPWLRLNAPDPWEELDPSIRDLVQELSNLPGIVTLSSCGGHDDAAAKEDEPGPGHWDVYLRPWFAFPEAAEAVWPDEDGWLAVEFLTWVVHDLRAAGKQIWVDVDASAPFLNGQGGA
jgi:hypothetical protein